MPQVSASDAQCKMPVVYFMSALGSQDTTCSLWFKALRSLGIQFERKDLMEPEEIAKDRPDILILETRNIDANGPSFHLKEMLNDNMGLIILDFFDTPLEEDIDQKLFPQKYNVLASFKFLDDKYFCVRVLQDSAIFEPFQREEFVLLGKWNPSHTHNTLKLEEIESNSTVISQGTNIIYIRLPLGVTVIEDFNIKETKYQLMRNLIKYLLLSKNIPVAEVWRWPNASKCACVITADVHIGPIPFLRRALMMIYILYNSFRQWNIRSKYFWDVLFRDPFSNECLSAQGLIESLSDVSPELTLFFQGVCAQRYPQIVKNAILNPKVSVGGHSSKMYLRSKLDFDQQLDDLKGTEELLKNNTGFIPDKIFRCHGCQYNKDTINTLKRLNYIAVSNDIIPDLYPSLDFVSKNISLINAPWVRNDDQNALYEIPMDVSMDSRDNYLRGLSFEQYLHKKFIPAFERQYQVNGMFVPLLHPGLIENGWKDRGFKRLQKAIQKIKQHDSLWFTNVGGISRWLSQRDRVRMKVYCAKDKLCIYLDPEMPVPTGFTIKISSPSPKHFETIDSECTLLDRHEQKYHFTSQYIVLKKFQADSMIFNLIE